MKVRTNSPEETRSLGKKLAREILKVPPGKRGLVFGLEGDLGGGKTTFLQGFARGLGIREKILSPTFVILKRFPLPGSGFQNFYHIDCYRLKGPREIMALGFEEIVSLPGNIVAVEWADRIRKVMPPGARWLRFSFLDEKKREIWIKM